MNIAGTAGNALDLALDKAELQSGDIDVIVSTGGGRDKIPFAKKEITGIGAGARGAAFLFPSVRTVIDVGAEEGRVIKCDPTGRVLRFLVNEKCAAGAGVFTEAMSRALGIEINHFGEMALQSSEKALLNTQCVIFAESEVVSLIHSGAPKSDIARIVCNTISHKISSQARAIGLEKDVALIGGMALNIGFVDSLKSELAVDLHIPPEPEFVGAIGAAIAGFG